MKRNYLILVMLLSFIQTKAITRVVTNTNNSGPGSLRQAVIDAISNDTIEFSSSLISGGNATIILTSGEITFSKNLTINGLITSSDTLFISGNNSSRIFNISKSVSTLNKMAIINGKVYSSSPGNTSLGGAIYLDSASVIISNSIIKQNSTISTNGSSFGGAIYSSFSILNIINSSVEDNLCISQSASSSFALGGGINSEFSTLNIISSTINKNSVTSNDYSRGGGINVYHSTISILNSIINENNINSSYGALGGGICIINNSSLVTINETIIDGNSVSSVYVEGGGIYIDIDSMLTITSSTINNNNLSSILTSSSNGYARGNGICTRYGYVTIKESTISDNSSVNNFGSESWGGGIYSTAKQLSIDKSTISNNSLTCNAISMGGGVYSGFGELLIKNSTISNNEVSGSGFLNGGGIFSDSLIIGSSIVALNIGGDNIDSSAIISYGYNIFSDSPIGYDSTDQINIDSVTLNLQSLALNGGTTKTMLPGVGSVAINMGNPSDLSNAQNGTIIGIRDVGAAEYILLCTPISSTLNDTICQGLSYIFGSQNLTTAGTYKDTLVNTGGCDSIVTLNLAVTLSVTPTISISSNQGTTICQGQQVIYSATITNGGTNPTYHWKRNGSNVGTGLTTYTSSANTNGDVMTCVLTSNATCASITTATSSDLTMVVNALPTVSITQNGINLEATTSYARYEWELNNSLISGATSNLYAPIQNGTYKVTVTDANGCENTASYNYSSVGVNEIDVYNINLYPNPATDFLNIEFNDLSTNNTQVYLYDMQGKMMPVSSQIIGNKIQLNVQDLANGFYTLFVNKDDMVIAKSVFITR